MLTILIIFTFASILKNLMDKTKTNINENILKIENTKNETVAIFDENDNYIGKDTRKNMRKNNLIHRCTSIIIINNKKQILVQTRALTKEYCPGYLTICTGGIIKDGDTVEQNAFKELYEELNIKIEKEKLKFLRKYFCEVKNIFKAWIYEFYIILNDEEIKQIFFNDKEVSKIDWIEKNELFSMFDDPSKKILTSGKEAIKELISKNIL